MGEFEEETAAGPAEGECPAEAEMPTDPAEQVDAAEPPADDPPADDVAADEPPAEDAAEEPAVAIQDQLALVPADAPADAPAEPPAEEPPAEDAAEEPPADDAPAADEPPAEGDAVPSDDDLAAAVAAAGEQVGTEGTLDDIAPGTVHVVADDAVEAEPEARYGVPWWPFLAYLGLWVVFSGVAIWQFQQIPLGSVAYETQQYTMFVFGGLALAVAGVFLTLAVWLVARTSAEHQRAGLFSSAFMKGALVVLIGVVVWWGTIMALDYLRLGRLI